MMDKTMLRANGTKNIIRAMETTGVQRFICQSSAGVGDSSDTLPFLMNYLIVPFLLRRAFADHEIQENYIKESQLDWVIARPAALTAVSVQALTSTALQLITKQSRTKCHAPILRTLC